MRMGLYKPHCPRECDRSSPVAQRTVVPTVLKDMTADDCMHAYQRGSLNAKTTLLLPRGAPPVRCRKDQIYAKLYAHTHTQELLPCRGYTISPELLSARPLVRQKSLRGSRKALVMTYFIGFLYVRPVILRTPFRRPPA